MKKIFFLLIIVFGFLACSQPDKDVKEQYLQSKFDSLQANAYTPGLGEFMLGFQVHHAKLFFAGKNQNWALADFEINEIKEAEGNIKKYCSDRPEVKYISMIEVPIQNVLNSIHQKNEDQFKQNFVALTNTCNTCHQTTQHAFNVIQIPDTPPFSNQDFKVHDSK